MRPERRGVVLTYALTVSYWALIITSAAIFGERTTAGVVFYFLWVTAMVVNWLLLEFLAFDQLTTPMINYMRDVTGSIISTFVPAIIMIYFDQKVAFDFTVIADSFFFLGNVFAFVLLSGQLYQIYNRPVK
jgi:hypothetical protein